MKKAYILFLSSSLLIACGGAEETETQESNSAGESSIIGTVNPDENEVVDQNDNGSSSEPTEVEGLTSIQYFESKHEFGSVFYPSDNKYTFKFKNTGREPLIIKSATASCGCTVPNKPEHPILPGEIGEMDVIFRPKAGQVGQSVTKKITVTANTSPAETFLEISATVIEAM